MEGSSGMLTKRGSRRLFATWASPYTLKRSKISSLRKSRAADSYGKYKVDLNFSDKSSFKMAWRNIDAIIPDKLYLGNINASRSTRSVTEHHITHILSVCEDQIPAEDPQSGFSHMRIAVEDVDYADLLIHLPSACQFIDQAIKSGGVVLVHCYQGLSRSAAVVAAYLMWSQGLGATQAIDLVRAARDQIWINAGFQEHWRAKLDRKLKDAGLLS
ncbi:hypothetical protein APHAL10511_001741 [Amanita phalloides]|nr:hypothetical protein APHAL10511_001741 [Amanita phalloides]